MAECKKIALITGASSGIGREFAVQIAGRYHSVKEFWLIARRRERLEKLAEQLKQLGKSVKVLEMDLQELDKLRELKDLLQEERPEIGFLVNAAGFGMIGRVAQQSEEELVGMVDVNCRALTMVTQAALPFLSRGSRVIQMASSAAFLPQPDFAVYAATKSYVLSFSRALGRELQSRGVRVCAVCPGPVKTEFFDIAEKYHQVKLYKKLVRANADQVVSLALDDIGRGKTVSVYGRTMKGFRALTKLVPTDFMLRFFSS